MRTTSRVEPDLTQLPAIGTTNLRRQIGGAVTQRELRIQIVVGNNHLSMIHDLAS
jgi:hypothetical protein